MKSLKLLDEFFEPVFSGKKTCTIRKGIRNVDFGPLLLESTFVDLSATVFVTEIFVKKLYEVTREDAIADGFNSTEELFQSLKRFYPDISRDDVVTVIKFEMYDDYMKKQHEIMKNPPLWVGGLSEKTYWEDFFLADAFLTAQRSIDTSTVHGAVWVSKDHRILSKGYNGPVRGSDDKSIPMTRPAKYGVMLHAEENCILNYMGAGVDTIDSTMYITGKPCHRCLRMMLQKGIKRIIHGPVNSKCIDEEDLAAQKIMLENREVAILEIQNMESVVEILERAINYIKFKCPDSVNRGEMISF